MSMQIDTNKLAMFRNVNFGSADSIVNIGDNKKSLVKNNELGSIFSRLGRSDEERAQNNAARTELLRALGSAFGLEGMTVSNGTVKFSQEFIKKLENILGRDVLKTGDFKINSDGTVTSGRPLTQRRINAILNKAVLFNPGQYNYDDYKAKLDYVQKRIDALPANSKNVDVGVLKQRFQTVGTMMNFVKKELPDLIDNIEYYPEADRDEDFPPFVVRKIDKNGVPEKPVQLKSLTGINDYVRTRNDGVPFHLQENIKGNTMASLAKLDNPKEEITNYYKNAIESYITLALDLFIECEKLGKLDKFFNVFCSPKICLEAKTDALTTFKLDELSKDGPVALYDRDQPLDQCMGKKIEQMLKRNPKLLDAGEFTAEIAAAMKKEFVGQIHPISTVDESVTTETKFTTKDAEGNKVVRKVTAADIDRIGQAVIDSILIG